MWTFIIVGVVIVFIVVVIIASIPGKSEKLGDDLGCAISGSLRILSKPSIPLKSNDNTYFTLYDGGISIMQNTTTIEVPWGAIYEINTENFSQIMNKDKSVIGRAAVGGLVFGEIGAIIGGMSGLQQSQEHVGGNLFLISFNYGSYGKAILGIRSDYGVLEFVEKYYELKKVYDNSLPIKSPSEIYDLGIYPAMQIIGEDHHDLANSIKYDKEKDLLIIAIDGRNADFNLLLNRSQKLEFADLLNKVIGWQEKSISSLLKAEKEVGMFRTDLNLKYSGEIHQVQNGEVALKYSCWFDTYDIETDEADDYYHIMIVTPNINITGEDVTIPGVILFLKISGIKSILSLISDSNIDETICEYYKEKSNVDSILN